MNSELKAKWIEALRSGAFWQGRQHLRQSNDDEAGSYSYCCLGVLGVVCKASFDADVEDEKLQAKMKLPSGAYSTNETLTTQILHELGMSSSVGSRLITLNDDKRLSFSEIADWIEKHDLSAEAPEETPL